MFVQDLLPESQPAASSDARSSIPILVQRVLGLAEFRQNPEEFTTIASPRSKHSSSEAQRDHRVGLRLVHPTNC